MLYRVSGGRSAICSLKATTAGQYRLMVLLYPESSLQKENPLPETVAESLIRVVDASASSAQSLLCSFWPPQGPVAGVPAGLVIQVRHITLLLLYELHAGGSHAYPLPSEPVNWKMTGKWLPLP